MSLIKDKTIDKKFFKEKVIENSPIKRKHKCLKRVVKTSAIGRAVFILFNIYCFHERKNLFRKQLC